MKSTATLAPAEAGPRGPATHPCYSLEGSSTYGRIHVPVAPRCNLSCGYCTRKFDCPNENRPGVTTTVLDVDTALDVVRTALARDPRLTVLGVAGPGDALANEATFGVFARAKEEFPQLTRCLSTNGLLLPDLIGRVVDVGIDTLTVTVNAVDPRIGGRIYPRVRYRRRTFTGEDGFTLLSRQQLEGIRLAARAGISVKVNSVLIPGVNDTHLVEVARLVRALGAHVHNVLPLIPLARFADLAAPSEDDVAAVRAQCAEVIDQFEGCRRCRADAIGVPGEEESCAVGLAPVFRSGTTSPEVTP